MCATNAVSNMPFLAEGCHTAARKGRSLKCGGRFSRRRLNQSSLRARRGDFRASRRQIFCLIRRRFHELMAF